MILLRVWRMGVGLSDSIWSVWFMPKGIPARCVMGVLVGVV